MISYTSPIKQVIFFIKNNPKCYLKEIDEKSIIGYKKIKSILIFLVKYNIIEKVNRYDSDIYTINKDFFSLHKKIELLEKRAESKTRLFIKLKSLIKFIEKIIEVYET